LGCIEASFSENLPASRIRLSILERSLLAESVDGSLGQSPHIAFSRPRDGDNVLGDRRTSVFFGRRIGIATLLNEFPRSFKCRVQAFHGFGPKCGVPTNQHDRSLWDGLVSTVYDR
jgi:hypothetical protein